MQNLHLEKAGVLGSIFAALCCIGFGPLLAVVSAIGAGFLVNDKVLLPLLLAFLALGAVGLVLSLRRHHRWVAIIAYMASAADVVIFVFILFNRTLVWIGLAGLVAAAVTDFLCIRRASRPPEVAHED